MRPNKISKLAMYTQTREPLIYLFIINSDFILDDDCKVIPFYALAGVGIKNKRIKFYYKSQILEMPREEIYFIILHEAYHIFKKHLNRHEDLHRENPQLLNIAQDVVINEELSNWPNKFDSKIDIIPRIIDGCYTADKEFLKENAKLGKDALTTRRVYNYLMNKKIKKEDLLEPGSFVRIKGTDKYGKIDSINKDKTYRVGVMSEEDFKEEIMGKKNGKHSKKNFKIDDLIPIVRGAVPGKGQKIDFDVEFIDSIDAHIPQEENDDIEQEVLAKKIFEQAKEMEKNASIKAGNIAGHFTSMIKELYTPKINWKKELNKHLNLFYSNNCKTKTKRKSFITYPWNPKSRYGILCKHTIEEIGNKQKYIIIAIDTSGSVFYNKNELGVFFTEIESMAKWFEFTKEGTILSIQWDAEIAEGLQPYQKNDWKKYKLKGGGGTTPIVVFNYFTKIYKKKNNHLVVNQDKIKFAINDPKKLPFVVVLTDGYFINKLKKSDLGIYSNCEKNVLFFTKNESKLDKNLKRIVYEGN